MRISRHIWSVLLSLTVLCLPVLPARAAPAKSHSTVASVVSSPKTLLVVMENGDVFGAGSNSDGLLCLPNTDGNNSISNWTKITTDVVAVSTHWGETLFVKTDGSLWGCGSRGVLTLSSDSALTTAGKGFLPPTKLREGVKKIADYHSLLLLTAGNIILEWDKEAERFKENTLFKNPTDVQSDFEISIVLESNGDLWLKKKEKSWEKILTNIARVKIASGEFLALKKDGTLWAYGVNEDGSLGLFIDGPDEFRAARVATPTLLLDKVVDFALDGEKGFALRTDGWLWGWGKRNKVCSFPDVGRTTKELLPYSMFSDEPMSFDILRPQKLLKGYYPLSTEIFAKKDGSLWTWIVNPNLAPLDYRVSGVEFDPAVNGQMCVMQKVVIKEGAPFINKKNIERMPISGRKNSNYLPEDEQRLIDEHEKKINP